jgi:hypothetical protein
LWNDEPKVNANHVDNANPHFGSASCGSFPREFLNSGSSRRSFCLSLVVLKQGIDIACLGAPWCPLPGELALLKDRAQHLSFLERKFYHHFG